MAGFGIHNAETLKQVFSFGFGAIIGSAYIRALSNERPIDVNTDEFFRSLE